MPIDYETLYVPYKDENIGIFYSLYNQTGKFSTRYKVESKINDESPLKAEEATLFKDDDKFWVGSRDDPNFTIIFDAPTLINNYTINSAPSGHSYPVKWYVSGSKNGKDWEIIDEQDLNGIVEGSLVTKKWSKTFKIANPNPYQQIRLTNLKNSEFSYEERKYLIFRSIEFYGSIERRIFCSKCGYRTRSKFNTYMFVTLLL